MKSYEKRVAYFSMGAGIYNDLLTYGGGLEILAGDMGKEVTDHQDIYPMTFIHVLWKYGYGKQVVNADGKVETVRPTNNNWKKYLEDTGKTCNVLVFNSTVVIKIWKLKDAPIYFLDTDIPENGDFCNITHYLYGGAWNDREKERIAQEIVLGIGGVRAIRALGIKIDAYHYNDGHPVFASFELINEYATKYLKEHPGEKMGREIFEMAVAHVKRRTCYTTHTNVPAGNETHPICLIDEVGVTRNTNLKSYELNSVGGEPFNMTVAALRLSKRANGVSRLQVLAAKKMWGWIREAPDITAITNGVHPGTWQSAKMKEAYEACDRKALYSEHIARKKRLIEIIEQNTGVHFRENALLIGFARRATEYKRWNLIFRDPKNFEELVRKYDIQIVFAGKSHRYDESGMKFIAEICDYAKKYPNNVVFLQGYDIELARALVTGSDIWLNNPRVPLEACGTSGIKAAMNGVLNLSTPDGWWREGCIDTVNGWNISTDEALEDSSAQDERDSVALYDVLENKVITSFNNKDKWVTMMFASITTSKQYTTGRMVEEYYVNMYNYLGRDV